VRCHGQAVRCHGQAVRCHEQAVRCHGHDTRNENRNNGYGTVLVPAISKEGHGRLMLRAILKTELVRMAGG
jgi:hypothetical protein